MEAKTLRIYILMSLAITIFLLVVLVGFEMFPLITGNDDFVVLQQANLQNVRVQLLAKDVLILAYRPDLYHTQAVSELQTILPNFRRVQPALMNGDAALGLPGNPSEDVRAFLNLGQSDYTAIVAAVDNILLHPNNTHNIVQVDIVLQHERAYTVAMHQAAVALQGEAEARKIQLLIIKLILIAAIGLIVILKSFLFTRIAVNRMIEREEKETDSIKNEVDDA